MYSSSILKQYSTSLHAFGAILIHAVLYFAQLSVNCSNSSIFKLPRLYKSLFSVKTPLLEEEWYVNCLIGSYCKILVYRCK